MNYFTIDNEMDSIRKDIKEIRDVQLELIDRLNDTMELLGKVIKFINPEPEITI